MKLPPLQGQGVVKIGIGILASLVVIVGGTLLFQTVFTKAADVVPRDLIINGITTSSAKVSWTTDQETQGVIEYGSTPTFFNLFAPEPQKTKSHTVEITLLSPGSSYYFQIRIGDTKYDNGGVPWTFATKTTNDASLSGTPTATISAAITITPVSPKTTVTQPTVAATMGPLPTSSLRVNPTATPTIRITPTPSAYVVPTLPAYVCGETDCQKICQKIGYTCSTQDWMRSGCVGRYSLGSCAIVTPTLTPTPTPTITSTPTPTSTSTPTPTHTPTPTPTP